MRFPALITLLAFFALSGCAWLGLEDEAPPPPPPPKVDEEKLAQLNAFPYEMMAPDAPPAPRNEKQGSPPGNVPDEYTWRAGHWEYKDNVGFYWKPGYWIRKPAFSAVWNNDLWMERTYGWTLVPGHWQ